MTYVDKLSVPELFRETALRWRLAGTACPECHGALYTHQALGPIGMGYHRCPACRLNYVQRNSVHAMDKLADALLDRAATETSLISYPATDVARLDPDTGALDNCRQPAPWKG